MKWPQLKKIEILWEDSTSSNGWHDTHEIDDDLKFKLTYSFGIYIKESKFGVAIANSFDPTTEDYNGIMVIPKSCIKKRRFL